MMWGEAVHGAWCGSRTWPTRCHQCSADVFFFSCECGCRVLFDDLGAPWPRHDCDRAWRDDLMREVDDTGTVRVEVASGVAVVRPGPELEIEDDEVVRRMASRIGSPDPIVAMDPPPTGAEDVLGVVREVTTHADPFAKLRLERTTMGAAAMGPVGTGPVGRVTIHAPSPVEDDLIESFTAWAPSAQLEDLKRGVTVEAGLKAVAVLGREPVWYCSSIRILS